MSATDVLDYDYDNCQFIESRNTRILPKEIETTYVYSKWQIETDVIPTLLSELMDTASATAWQGILDENDRLKGLAEFVQNYSFDGLTTVTETMQSSKSESFNLSFQFMASEEFNTENGF